MPSPLRPPGPSSPRPPRRPWFARAGDTARVRPHAAARSESLERRLHLSAGQRDDAFGVGGVARVDVPGMADAAYSVALQPDGKVVVAGTSELWRVPGPSSGNSTPDDRSAFVARFLPGGAPDAAFGDGGKVVLRLDDFPAAAAARAASGASRYGDVLGAAGLVLTPGGSIVVAGGVGFDGRRDSVLIRLDPAGAIDRSFGTGGIAIHDLAPGNPDLPTNDDTLTRLALDGAGRIVGALHGVNFDASLRAARFFPDGSHDVDFGGDGTVEATVGVAARATDVLVRPGGGIVVAGAYQTDTTGWSVLVGLAAWDADGVPDPSFGDGGVVRNVFAPPPHQEFDRPANDAPRLAALPGGAIAVADAAYDAVHVTRLTASGAPDPTFNGGAKLTLRSAPATRFTLAGVAPLPGGKLAVGGIYQTSQDSHLAMWRLTPSGTPDETFGPGGATTVNVDAGSSAADLRVQPDGKVVVAGGDVAGWQWFSFREGGAWVTRFLPDPAPRAAPLADAGGNIDGAYVTPEGRDLWLDAGRSFDGDAPLAKYEWDTDYNGATFTPDVEGRYANLPGAALRGPASRVVAVRVTDSDGNTAIATAPLTVVNVAPALTLGGAATAAEGVPYTLALASSDPSAADAVQYWTIDWGDGSAPQRVDGNPASVTHLFRDGPALDRITATATDNDGTWPATVGRPDPGHGTGGVIDVYSINDEGARGFARAADGGLFVAGSRQSGVPTFYHFKPDGTFDATFNGGRGYATIPAPSPIPGMQVSKDADPHGAAVAVQPDGKVIAALPTLGGPNGVFARHWLLVRINPDGSPDTGFGNGGAVGPMFNGLGDAPDDLLLLPDGKFLVAGEADGRFTLARFNADGTPDTTFGTNGLVNDTFGAVPGHARAIRRLPDGRIVAAGYVGGDSTYALARYTADGAPDPTFGSNGAATGLVPGYARTRLTTLALSADGGVVAGAESYYANRSEPQAVHVLRLRPDGSFDPSFGTGGIREVTAGPRHHLGAIALLPEGKYLLAGNAGSTDALLQRLLPDGSPDPSFGNAPGVAGLLRHTVNSYYTTSLGVHDLLLTPDGDALLLGAPQRNGGGMMLLRYDVLGAVAVANAPPAVAVNPSRAAVRPGEAFELELSYQDPGDDRPVRWVIDWGDGGVPQVVHAPAASVAHTYAAAGAYTITASVVDDDGTWPAAAAQQMRVVPPPTLGPDGLLTITGTDFAESIQLFAEGADLAVVISGLSESFDLDDVRAIDLRALGGNDSISIGAGVGPAGGIRVAGGDGNDSLSLPSGASGVDFDAGNGSDSLTVRATAGDDAVSVTATSVVVAPAAGGATNTVTYTSAETLTVLALDGADVITVGVADAAPPTGPAPINIDPGAGDDRLDVTALTAGRTLTSVRGAGADTVTVGAGSLGRVVVNADALDTTYFDGGDGDDVFTLVREGVRSGTRSLAVQNNPGPVPAPLTVRGGAGGDTFTLADLPYPGVLADGGPGNDRYEFGALVNLLLGNELTVRGGDGEDTVSVDYSFVPGVLTYVISDTLVSSGFGRFPVGDAESVVVTAALHADTFRVTPSDRVTFSVFGNNPAAGAPTGDRLAISLNGAEGMQLEPGANPGAGRFTFTNRRPVNFDGIEIMPEFVPPTVTAATFLDTAAPSVRFTFSEPVTGLSVNTLVLEDVATGATRRPASMQSSPSTNTYTFVFTNLPDGDYRARLLSASITDASANRLAEDYVLALRNTNAVHVAGRHMFYNNSAADGRDTRLNAADNAAIAADKSALLPGQAATFANYTSSSRGINGVMIDLARAGASFTPAARHFRFDVAPPGAADGWRTAVNPSEYAILRGAGVNGTDRVLLSWPDGTFRNLWLRVTVLHPSNSAAVIDVFYFGNLVGDTGGAAATVDGTDLALTRRAAGRTDAASLNRYDFNRDGAVTAADVLLARANQRRSLPLFTAPPASAAASANPPLPASPLRISSRPLRRGPMDGPDDAAAGVLV